MTEVAYGNITCTKLKEIIWYYNLGIIISDRVASENFAPGNIRLEEFTLCQNFTFKAVGKKGKTKR